MQISKNKNTSKNKYFPLMPGVDSIPAAAFPVSIAIVSINMSWGKNSIMFKV